LGHFFVGGLVWRDFMTHNLSNNYAIAQTANIIETHVLWSMVLWHKVWYFSPENG
jgi:hypothetical protein